MKNLFKSCWINEHSTAIAAAVAVHVAVAAWVLPSAATPVEMQPQVIRISMVAPSAPPQEEAQVKTEVAPPPAPVAPPKPEAPKVQKRVERKPVEERKVVEQQPVAPSIPTSGLQAPDATEKAAARTDPIYNAAYLNNPAPVYPPPARKRGIQGKVMLEVAVSAKGDARQVEVARSSGSELLDDAALDAVRRWHFVPARQGSEVIEARVLVPVEFKLN
ncbi:MAG: energy transducer TonB [Bdellovibrionales bacterium]